MQLMTDHIFIIRLHAPIVNRNGSSELGFTRKDHERLTVATTDELVRNDSNPPSVNIPACQKETGTLADAFPSNCCKNRIRNSEVENAPPHRQLCHPTGANRLKFNTIIALH